MKAILLNGSDANDTTGEGVRKALMAQLQAQDWQVEHFALCESKIGNCAGDFFCWIRTPGMCNVDDDNREIAAAVINSDLVVFLSPVTFGGYSSTLKGMVDHLIQNVSPFFTMVEGETHHRKRYKSNPDLLGVGWMDEAEARSEAVFRHGPSHHRWIRHLSGAQDGLTGEFWQILRVCQNARSGRLL
jgi:hypothetical protein